MPDGVPNWVADKINRVFDCSDVLVDGKGFTRMEESRMEPSRQKQYAMAGWIMDILESKNAESKVWGSSGIFASQFTNQFA
jgi:hypothetical protein